MLPAALADLHGVSDDPNAPPTHGEQDKAAVTQVQKGNYRAAMGKLEKEDLSADRKVSLPQ
jgi:hypothetical protein